MISIDSRYKFQHEYIMKKRLPCVISATNGLFLEDLKANNQLNREEYFRSCYPIRMFVGKWRAISWATAASLAAVIEMVADKKLPQKGFIKQEEIKFNDFLSTKNGKYFH